MPMTTCVGPARCSAQAASKGAQVACLPELFRTQYFCQAEDSARFDLAEPIPGPTTEALAAVAREAGMVVVGSIFEKRAAGLYHNTAVVLDADGTLRGRYRKMHIPDDPLYYEKYYFTPGDLGFTTFTTRFARVGTLVCWDQWYPEAARLTALKGAEILFYPDGDRLAPGREGRVRRGPGEAWETIQRSHAIANGVYVAAVNRIGHEGACRRRPRILGRSFLADPFGRIVARAGQDTEEVLSPIATRSCRKKPAATGRSSAIAGSTPTARSPSGS